MLSLTFGTNGTASPHLGDGWLRPEGNTHRTSGSTSTLTVKLPPGVAGSLHLELALCPFFPQNKVAHQTLVVSVNGHSFAPTLVQGNDEAVLGYHLPAELIAGSAELRIVLGFPGAVSPQALQLGPDARLFAFRVSGLSLHSAPTFTQRPPRRLPPIYLPRGNYMASRPNPEITASIRQATGLEPAELVMRFESLGGNCEFGVFQSRCGASPLGLLRFNSVALARVLEGLEHEFAGADDPGLIRLEAKNRALEYFMVNDRYNFRMHTFRHVGDVPEDELHRTLVISMKFLRRRLLETLREAEKIFVYQRQTITTPAHMLPLLRRLRAYGENRLVYVTEDELAAPGTVDDLGGGLYHAYIDRLAPTPDVHSLNVAPWLSICANTLALIG